MACRVNCRCNVCGRVRLHVTKRVRRAKERPQAPAIAALADAIPPCRRRGPGRPEMTPLRLAMVIAEARALANDHPCTTVGHNWQTEGGRRCPRATDEDDGCGGSQAVYRCARCGGYDYGEPGGPGASDCERTCRPEHPMGHRIY